MEQRDQAKKQKTWIPAEAIGNNIDFMTQILLKVPAKPLIKCKCVSKQWLSLISDPQFCLSHTRHHHTSYPTPTALLVRDDNSFNPKFQIIPLKDDTISKLPSCDYLNAPCLRIKQSCNDLLLFSSTSFTKIIPTVYGPKCVPEYTYYICNPTTKQFKKLSFPSYQFKDSVVALNLALDDKVISIRKVSKVKEHEELKFRINMYASETDSWSLLGITFNGPNGIEFNDAVFCNGAIHWNSNDVNSLYFDVDNECKKTMSMPKLSEFLSPREVRYFGESCGHLHLVVTYNPNALKFNVLEMAADYSQWFVRYHVDLDALRIAIPEFILSHERWYFPFSVLGVIRAEKEEESMIVLFVDGRAVSYNPYNGISKKLCAVQFRGGLRFDGQRFQAHQYFETLSRV